MRQLKGSGDIGESEKLVAQGRGSEAVEEGVSQRDSGDGSD